MKKGNVIVIILTIFMMLTVCRIASAENYGRELNLPIKLPPVEFTHPFGKLSTSEGGINDEFEIEYLNLIENNGKNHYKINVRPIEQKGNFKINSKKVKTYHLKDGTESLYISTKHSNPRAGFNALVFEKKGWQYRLAIDHRMEHKVPVKMLVEIANSVK